MKIYKGFSNQELEHSNPINLFKDWFETAKSQELNDPDAMALATADSDNFPNVRMVLLKKIDHGFVFFSNNQSQKGEELTKNSKAALCFHWKSIRKQVRIQGKVSIIKDQEADDYFETRPRGSRIGAITSKQSSFLESPEKFEKEYKAYEKEVEGKDIKRPDYWVGYRLIPTKIEFWLNAEYRLHQRIRFTKENTKWKKEFLYP